MTERSVAIVAFEGVQGLDVVGPVEVFAAAPGYEVSLLTATGQPVTTSSGLALTPHGDLDRDVDTLVVAGGEGTATALSDRVLVDGIVRLARGARRVTSVCSGAFLLAEAGLLDGRKATTHWSVCDTLAARYPSVTVEPDPIYVRDGNVWTSAGVTAGMDLALALVEDDHGRDAALAVARRLVMFLHRPANQAQFSAQLAAQLAERDAVRSVQQWIADHPGADLTVDAMARHAAMSPRHFARVFRDEVGVTPARYVETVRVEAARVRLESGSDGVEAVAAACGFGSPETMRRAFVRTVGVAPAEYRRRFRTAAPQP